MRDTRGATNTLRGLAIAVVMINHYVLNHVSASVGGIAYTFLAVFFLVSGWGVQISMQRRGMSSDLRGTIFRFWGDRLLRLLPLYYLAIILRDLASGGLASPLFYINIYAEGHYWFVPAIINCYLAAPFLHLLLHRMKGRAVIAASAVVFIGTAILMSGAVPPQGLELLGTLQLVYKRCFLLHVLLFLVGMYAAANQNKLVKTADVETGPGILSAYWACFMLFPLGYWLAKNMLHGMPAYLGQLAMLATTVLLFATGIRHCIGFVFPARIGAVSYGLYLFHMTYLNLIDRTGLLHGLVGVAVACGLFPVLYFWCLYLEKAAGRLAHGVTNLLEKSS